MRVAIHQPYYMPWCGWFNKMHLADVFVIADDFQYSRGERFNRVEVAKRDWMTVPVTARVDARICNAKVDGDAWIESHVGIVRARFGKVAAEALSDWLERCARPFAKGELLLAALTSESAMDVARTIGIETQVVFASDMEYDRELKRTEKLIAIVQELGGDEYLSGSGGSKWYLDVSAMNAAGINVAWQKVEDSGLTFLGMVEKRGSVKAIEEYVKTCGGIEA